MLPFFAHIRTDKRWMALGNNSYWITTSMPIDTYKCWSTHLICYQYSDSYVFLELTINNKTYELDTKKYVISEVQQKKEKPTNRDVAKSPDGKWIAYSKDYNLYIKDTNTEEEYQLSSEGNREYQYASGYGWYDKMEGENGERPKRFNVNWSENSKWISAYIVDTRNAEKMYMLDYSIDSLYKPKLFCINVYEFKLVYVRFY